MPASDVETLLMYLRGFSTQIFTATSEAEKVKIAEEACTELTKNRTVKTLLTTPHTRDFLAQAVSYEGFSKCMITNLKQAEGILIGATGLVGQVILFPIQCLIRCQFVTQEMSRSLNLMSLWEEFPGQVKHAMFTTELLVEIDRHQKEVLSKVRATDAFHGDAWRTAVREIHDWVLAELLKKAQVLDGKDLAKPFSTYIQRVYDTEIQQEFLDVPIFTKAYLVFAGARWNDITPALERVSEPPGYASKHNALPALLHIRNSMGAFKTGNEGPSEFSMCGWRGPSPSSHPRYELQAADEHSTKVQGIKAW